MLLEYYRNRFSPTSCLITNMINNINDDNNNSINNSNNDSNKLIYNNKS